MDSKKCDQDGFNINSFYPAAFLFAKGCRLLRIDRSDSRRVDFVFEDSDELRRLLEAFNFAEVDDLTLLVDARGFISAVRSLKEKIYQGI